MSQMLFYMNLLFIVIAVSLDGFGVGITYGMRKMRIPFAALFVIMLCSGVIVLIAMMIGQVLRTFISPAVASSIGSVILILIGVFVLCSVIRNNRRGMSAKVDTTEFSREDDFLVDEGNGMDRKFSEGDAKLGENFTEHEAVNQLQHFKSVLSDPFQADKDKSG